MKFKILIIGIVVFIFLQSSVSYSAGATGGAVHDQGPLTSTSALNLPQTLCDQMGGCFSDLGYSFAMGLLSGLQAGRRTPDISINLYLNPVLSVGNQVFSSSNSVCVGSTVNVKKTETKAEWFGKGGPVGSPPVVFVTEEQLQEIILKANQKRATNPERTSVAESSTVTTPWRSYGVPTTLPDTMPADSSVADGITLYRTTIYSWSTGFRGVSPSYTYGAVICSADIGISGTGTSCSSFNTQTSCQAQSDCRWTPVYSCAGTFNCNQFSKSTTCRANGCEERGKSERCSGTFSCSRYTTESPCQAIKGCSWGLTSYQCSSSTPVFSPSSEGTADLDIGLTRTCIFYAEKTIMEHYSMLSSEKPRYVWRKESTVEQLTYDVLVLKSKLNPAYSPDNFMSAFSLSPVSKSLKLNVVKEVEGVDLQVSTSSTGDITKLSISNKGDVAAKVVDLQSENKFSVQNNLPVSIKPGQTVDLLVEGSGTFSPVYTSNGVVCSTPPVTVTTTTTTTPACSSDSQCSTNLCCEGSCKNSSEGVCRDANGDGINEWIPY